MTNKKGLYCSHCGKWFRPWRIQDGSAEAELCHHERICIKNTQNKEKTDTVFEASNNKDMDYNEFMSTEDKTNLVIEGNLWLKYTQIKELPDNLTVKGDFYLGHTKIKKLPNNLTIGGNFDMCYTLIEKIPTNLKIGKSFSLNNTKIKKLPDNLTIGGNLWIAGTLIKELPDNLVIGGKIFR